VNVGHVFVVGPLLEQVSHVDNICAFYWWCWVPVFDFPVPDFEAWYVALEEECYDAKVTVGTDTYIVLDNYSSGKKRQIVYGTYLAGEHAHP
jgi:hypothetical protein